MIMDSKETNTTQQKSTESSNKTTISPKKRYCISFSCTITIIFVCWICCMAMLLWLTCFEGFMDTLSDMYHPIQLWLCISAFSAMIIASIIHVIILLIMDHRLNK